MSIYAKPSKELVFDLIAESNPNLPFPVTKDNTTLGPPVAFVPSGGRIQNTEIELFPRLPSGYIKKTKVKYRRINLGSLFKGTEIVLPAYTPVGIGGNPFQFHELLAQFNKDYGMSLTVDDVENPWFPAGTDNYYPGKRTVKTVVKAKPGSLGFIGEMVVRWVFIEQEVGEVIVNRELDCREYPGGNDFDNNHKYVLNLLSYGIDFTELADDYESGIFQQSPLGTGSAAALAAQQRTLDYIALYSGVTLDKSTENTEFGVKQSTSVKYQLPHPDVPHANPKFSAVVVVSYPQAGTWATGQLYLHYNV